MYKRQLLNNTDTAYIGFQTQYGALIPRYQIYVNVSLNEMHIVPIFLREDSKEYYIEGVLQVIYELRDGGKTSETINVGIEVTILDDSIYFIECAYRIDDEDDEGDEDESEV